MFKSLSLALVVVAIAACGVGGESITNSSSQEESSSSTGGSTGSSGGGSTATTTGSSTGTGSTTGSGSTTGGTTGLAPALNCTGSYCNQTTATCEGGNSIRLNWGSDGRSNTYRILKRGEGGSNSDFDIAGTTYLDTVVARGIRYIYRVKYGAISASNEASAICP